MTGTATSGTRFLDRMCTIVNRTHFGNTLLKVHALAQGLEGD